MKKNTTQKELGHQFAHPTWRQSGVGVVFFIVGIALLYTFYSGWVSREFLRPTTDFDSPAQITQ